MLILQTVAVRESAKEWERILIIRTLTNNNTRTNTFFTGILEWFEFSHDSQKMIWGDRDYAKNHANQHQMFHYSEKVLNKISQDIWSMLWH